MHLRDLEFFIAVAESGSFHRAAVRADVTQPAITKAIKRLESELGVTLLDRSQRGTILSDAGRAFLERAYRLQGELSATLREAADMRSRTQGLVRIGVAPSLMERFFRDPCGVFLGQRPAARISLQIALSDELFASLKRGDMDLVICALPASLEPAFEAHPIGTSILMVVADANHPAQTAASSLEQLTGFDWVLPRRGVLSRDWIDDLFARSSLPLPTVRIEMDTQTDSLMPLVIGSDLLSISSLSSGNEVLHPGLRRLPLEQLTWHRRVAAFTRAREPVSPLATHFIDVARRCVARQKSSASVPEARLRSEVPGTLPRAAAS